MNTPAQWQEQLDMSAGKDAFKNTGMTTQQIHNNLTAGTRFVDFLKKIGASYDEDCDMWEVQTDEDEGKPIFTLYKTERLYSRYFLNDKRP